VLKISEPFLKKTVEELIQGKFGTDLGGNIIKAIDKCLSDDSKLKGIPLLSSIMEKLKTYSEVEQQAVWDFLYHFVIVG